MTENREITGVRNAPAHRENPFLGGALVQVKGRKKNYQIASTAMTLADRNGQVRARSSTRSPKSLMTLCLSKSLLMVSPVSMTWAVQGRRSFVFSSTRSKKTRTKTEFIFTSWMRSRSLGVFQKALFLKVWRSYWKRVFWQKAQIQTCFF